MARGFTAFRSSDPRQRGLFILLVDTFLMWGGFFLLVPLLSVHYVDDLGWAAGTIGMALAVRQLTQQGLGPVGGALGDRFGAKQLLLAGLLIRAAGFAITAMADTFPILLISVLIAGIGGGLFEAPQAAMIASLTDESNRNRFYALSGTVGAIGTAIGTQVGVLLLQVEFALVALVAASCYVVALTLTAFALPAISISTGAPGEGSGLVRALRDWPFVRYSLMLIGFWFCWVQFSISVPLRAIDVSGEGILRWLFLLNTGMTILLGYPLLRVAEKFIATRTTLVAGIAIAAIGYATLAAAGNSIYLLASVALIALGMLLAYPTQRTLAANLSDPSALGSYLGVNALSLAIGGGIGNLGGGVLYDFGQRHDLPGLPWLIIGAIGLLSAIGIIFDSLQRLPKTIQTG